MLTPTQYCNSGDLHNYILNPVQPATSAKETLKDRLRRRSRGQPEPPQPLHRKLPFDTIISFFRDIASGLSHLHSNGFIHRDLKPSNCLLHEPVPGHGLRVLVSDFGEVQMVDAMRASTGTTGTISYCAPEVLRRAGPGGEEFGNFTTKSDVFSLGMILHFICFGSLPYRYADERCEENEDLDSLRDEITAWRGLDMDRRSGLPEKLYHSLRTLISPDPAVRPSAEEILLGIEMQGIGLDAFEDTAPQGHGLKVCCPFLLLLYPLTRFRNAVAPAGPQYVKLSRLTNSSASAAFHPSPTRLHQLLQYLPCTRTTTRTLHPTPVPQQLPPHTHQSWPKTFPSPHHYHHHRHQRLRTAAAPTPPPRPPRGPSSYGRSPQTPRSAASRALPRPYGHAASAPQQRCCCS